MNSGALCYPRGLACLKFDLHIRVVGLFSLLCRFKMIESEAVVKTLTRQHSRDAVEINYSQVCSLNDPTVYGCVLQTRFRKAHNCTEAHVSVPKI